MMLAAVIGVNAQTDASDIIEITSPITWQSPSFANKTFVIGSLNGLNLDYQKAQYTLKNTNARVYEFVGLEFTGWGVDESAGVWDSFIEPILVGVEDISTTSWDGKGRLTDAFTQVWSAVEAKTGTYPEKVTVSIRLVENFTCALNGEYYSLSSGSDSYAITIVPSPRTTEPLWSLSLHQGANIEGFSYDHYGTTLFPMIPSSESNYPYNPETQVGVFDIGLNVEDVTYDGFRVFMEPDPTYWNNIYGGFWSAEDNYGHGSPADSWNWGDPIKFIDPGTYRAEFTFMGTPNENGTPAMVQLYNDYVNDPQINDARPPKVLISTATGSQEVAMEKCERLLNEWHAKISLSQPARLNFKVDYYYDTFDSWETVELGVDQQRTWGAMYSRSDGVTTQDKLLMPAGNYHVFGVFNYAQMDWNQFCIVPADKESELRSNETAAPDITEWVDDFPTEVPDVTIVSRPSKDDVVHIINIDNSKIKKEWLKATLGDRVRLDIDINGNIGQRQLKNALLKKRAIDRHNRKSVSGVRKVTPEFTENIRIEGTFDDGVVSFDFETLDMPLQASMDLTPQTAYYLTGEITDYSKSDKSLALNKTIENTFECVVMFPQERDELKFCIAPESAFTAEMFEKDLIGPALPAVKDMKGLVVPGEGVELTPEWTLPKPKDGYDAYRLIVNMATLEYEMIPVNSTGIADLTADENNENSPVYNLAGQRVDNPQRGVFVQKGKKFIK